MTRSKILDIVTLTREGWQPYEAQPEQSVYDKLGCELAAGGKKNKPFWFVSGDLYCCIGCIAHCTLKNPEGFQPVLPLGYPEKTRKHKYYLTPAQMLERHDLLNAKQAAYCLNVSERTIYNYIAEGKLVRLRESPVRVRSAEVRALRENFDE